MSLITDSGSFLEKKAGTGRLTFPITISLLLGASLSLQAVAVYMVYSPETDDVIDILIILGISYFFEGLLLWFLFSIVIYAIASMAGGSPLMGHTLRIVGWGLLPFVPSGAVWAVGIYYSTQDNPLIFPETVGIGHELDAIREFTSQAISDPIYLITFLLGYSLLLGSVYLWTKGLVRTTYLTGKQSVIVALTPAILYLFWELRVFI